MAAESKDAESDPAPGTAQGPALAIAVEEAKGTGSPRVTASGRGALAEQILEIAFARGVKVREDADLAEILAAIEVDSEIPVEALAAVAEILSYVYRANAAAPQPDEDGGA